MITYNHCTFAEHQTWLSLSYANNPLCWPHTRSLICSLSSQEMAQWVNCCTYKPGDLRLIPEIHVKSLMSWKASEISVFFWGLRTWRQGNWTEVPKPGNLENTGWRSRGRLCFIQLDNESSLLKVTFWPSFGHMAHTCQNTHRQTRTHTHTPGDYRHSEVIQCQLDAQHVNMKGLADIVHIPLVSLNCSTLSKLSTC